MHFQPLVNDLLRLEYLRGELRAERISYGELAELQSLKRHIELNDVELLEAAGVPEFAPSFVIAPDSAIADIQYLLEAYDYGQFADDMLDHPSPSCRAPCKPLREALRRHLDWLQTLELK